MAKSDYGLDAHSGATKQSISDEEWILRWKYAWGEFPGMTEEQLKEKIEQVRKETGKP